MKHISSPYTEFESTEQLETLPSEFLLIDHAYGFDKDFNNILLDRLQELAIKKDRTYKVNCTQFYCNNIKKKYNRLNITFNFNLQCQIMWEIMSSYNAHLPNTFDNFICSFNGSEHVSRKLLLAVIEQMGWFRPDYISKNFSFTVDQLDGHINELIPQQSRLYRKFFINENSNVFFQQINSFGHNRFQHNVNIQTLQPKITSSWLHLVSESLSTSYHPYITEKFLYSVLNRGLFLTYGQPGWHAHLEKYYGFRKFEQIFDYSFDNIQNPIVRLVNMIGMLSPFSRLSKFDWHDLYLLEFDTIEYNYDHYYSKKYLQHLKKAAKLNDNLIEVKHGKTI